MLACCELAKPSRLIATTDIIFLFSNGAGLSNPQWSSGSPTALPPVSRPLERAGQSAVPAVTPHNCSTSSVIAGAARRNASPMLPQSRLSQSTSGKSDAGHRSSRCFGFGPELVEHHFPGQYTHMIVIHQLKQCCCIVPHKERLHQLGEHTPRAKH